MKDVETGSGLTEIKHVLLFRFAFNDQRFYSRIFLYNYNLIDFGRFTHMQFNLLTEENTYT